MSEDELGDIVGDRLEDLAPPGTSPFSPFSPFTREFARIDHAGAVVRAWEVGDDGLVELDLGPDREPTGYTAPAIYVASDDHADLWVDYRGRPLEWYTRPLWIALASALVSGGLGLLLGTLLAR